MTTKHTNSTKKLAGKKTAPTATHRHTKKTNQRPREISKTTAALVLLLGLIFIASMSMLYNTNLLKADLYTNVPAQKTSPTEYGGLTKEQFLAFGSDQIKSKSAQAKTEIEKSISSLGLDKDPLASSSVDVCYPETVSRGWITAYTAKNCYYKKLLVIPTDTPRENLIAAINSNLKNNGWELSNTPQNTACYELNQIKKKQSAFSEETRGLYANIYIGGPDYNYKKIVDGQCNVLDGQFQDSSMPAQRTIIDQSLFDEKNIQDELISKASPTVIRASFTSEYYSKTLKP